MAVEVLERNEVLLNSIRYPIVGQLSPMLVSLHPEKQVIGDYSVDSDKYKSAWVINDQRGGILVEEMDEKIHANRSWWSTCQTQFKGHLVLPQLATSITPIAARTADTWISPTDFIDVDATWTNDANAYDGDTGTAATDAVPAATWTGFLELDVPVVQCSQIRFWYNNSNPTSGDLIDIDVFYNNAWNNVLETDAAKGAWVTQSLGATYAVTAARVRGQIAASGTFSLFELAFYTTDTSVGTPVDFEDFNSLLYYAHSNTLLKLNGTGDGFTHVRAMRNTITDLISSIGTNLYLFLGDSSNYWYMNTSEAFTETNVANATYGIEWDSKLFKTDSAGALSYAATPNSATPTWTANGSLPIQDNEVKRLFLFYNIDGDDIIYAGTARGLWGHDYTNSKWLQTQLKTPNHTNSGKGVAVWRDGAYISAGLDVLKYIPDVPATIQSVGLDRDDGLPSEYDGEIVKFIEGYNEFYALIDSTQVTGTSTSSVMAYDGRGWRVVWIGDTTEKAMVTGIVSSVVRYALWFDHNKTIYYIPLSRSLRNPLKISSETFGTSGVHITPWFDADWQVGNKLALKHDLFASEDVSADETIIVKYRLDHATTAVASTWTTAQTITTSGLNTYTFGSSLGTAFKAIQFRYELVHAAGSTTETPDILYAVLYYAKVLPKKWGWKFTVDCSHAWHGQTSKQLLDALVTAAEVGTLVAFQYDATTKYVEIYEVTGSRLTGADKQGTFAVTVVEV